MIIANCICGKKIKLNQYIIIIFDKFLLHRLYYGYCSCGIKIEQEDWKEIDQIYLDCPELQNYLSMTPI